MDERFVPFHRASVLDIDALWMAFRLMSLRVAGIATEKGK
jgi:hypothetical protein